MKPRLFSLFTKLVAVCVFLSLALPALAAEAPKKVLVVNVTAGFRHSEGIDASIKVLPKLAQASGAFVVEFVDQPPNQPNRPRKPASPSPADEEKYKADEAKFQAAQAAWTEAMKLAFEKLAPQNLKNYDAVIFNNTTGDLPLPDREAFLAWLRSGKGFIGIHAATDTYHNFPPYLEMIGGEFAGHGPQATVDCLNQDQQHPACKPLPAILTVHDEIYLMKNFDRKKVHGLLTLDKHPNNRTPGDYPIAWCKEYGKGRVFYTSLGHRADVWDDDTPANVQRQNSKEVAISYQKHLVGGIRWVLGLEPGDATPQVK
jgi:type 1 glutamine amidotransferase